MRSFMITAESKGTVRRVGQVAYMGEKRNVGRPRHSWEDSIEISFKRIRLEGVADFILLRICSSGRLSRTRL
jgi:hypothetical protein